MAKRRVNLYLDESMIDGLDRQARCEGRTKTEVIRRALVEYFANHEQLLNEQERLQAQMAQLAMLKAT